MRRWAGFYGDAEGAVVGDGAGEQKGEDYRVEGFDSVREISWDCDCDAGRGRGQYVSIRPIATVSSFSLSDVHQRPSMRVALVSTRYCSGMYISNALLRETLHKESFVA